jgi:hypothetical protein
MTTPPRERGAGRTPLWSALALLTVVLLATACTSARSNLGTSDSSCYVALPTASKAVGAHARLIGVHLFTRDELEKEAPKLQQQVASQLKAGEKVCVLAFSGHFTTASVSKGRGRSSGSVAVAVVANPTNRLLGTVILQRLPLRFAHSHIG